MLYFRDELNGVIEEGYQEVEDKIAPDFAPIQPLFFYHHNRDVVIAEMTSIVVSTMIDTAEQSGGSFSKLVNDGTMAEIANEATRAIMAFLEVED